LPLKKGGIKSKKKVQVYSFNAFTQKHLQLGLKVIEKIQEKSNEGVMQLRSEW
jgi:hypothetical protein